jgi:hypothetical protein
MMRIKAAILLCALVAGCATYTYEIEYDRLGRVSEIRSTLPNRTLFNDNRTIVEISPVVEAKENRLMMVLRWLVDAGKEAAQNVYWSVGDDGGDSTDIHISED